VACVTSLSDGVKLGCARYNRDVFSVANSAGSLLEIRVSSPFSMQDAMRLFKQIYKTMPRGRVARVVADLRGLRIVDPDVVDLVTNFMKMDNPAVERNAFVLPDSGALLGIQSDRMLRTLGVESRRSFRHREEAEQWMAEVCTPEERHRMSLFLDEPHA
jgi:hypothetical protein